MKKNIENNPLIPCMGAQNAHESERGLGDPVTDHGPIEVGGIIDDLIDINGIDDVAEWRLTKRTQVEK